jgi:putative tryptophan/tyrosine transport system substrate-binding protein
MLQGLIFIPLALLMSMTLALPAMAGSRIWVALGEGEEPYTEVAGKVQAELVAQNEVTIARWPILRDSPSGPPDLLVTVGVSALDGMLEVLGNRKDTWQKVPLLALLVPRVIAAARQAAPSLGQRAFSAIMLDQPLDRQLALIKRAMPDRTKVGILPGRQVRAQYGELQKAANTLQLRLTIGPEIDEAKDISAVLREVLESADLILALPDPDVYYKQSIQYILLTAYRARIPLVAYSQSFVRSGALLGLYSTPAQIAAQAAEMVHTWQSDRSLPPIQVPRYFTVDINAKVARSLNITLDDAAEITRDLMR